MKMLTRRGAIGAMAFGGLGPARPDQHYEPPAGGQAIPGQRAILRARTVIIFGTGPNSGLFAYSPVPGAGNLVASISSNGGTDPFGNVYLTGMVTYDTNLHVATQVFEGGIQFWQAASEAGPWTGLGKISDALWNEPSGETITLQVGAGIDQVQIANNSFSVAVLSNIVASGNNNPVLLVQNTNPAPNVAAFRILAAATGDRCVSIRGGTDIGDRIQITSDGIIHFGSGAVVPDTVIYRAAAAQLAADPIAFNKSGVAETWQAPTFTNGWANAGTQPNLQFRLVAAPYNCIQWVGAVTVPVGFVAGQQVALSTPAAYHPAKPQSVLAVDRNTGALARFQNNAGGALFFESGAAAAGDVLEITAGALVSLDA